MDITLYIIDKRVIIFQFYIINIYTKKDLDISLQQ
jgi:hypothetical protein